MENMLFAAELLGLGVKGIAAIVGIFGGLAIFVMIYASRYTKCGPNEVLIISGKKYRIIGPDGQPKSVGYRLLQGGGTFVWPVFEKVDVLSLELLTIDVRTPEVYTKLGVPIIVDGVAQVKVRGEDVAIRTAAEQFLSKGPAEIQNISMQTLEGHLRAILGTMTVEEIYQDREAFAQRVQGVAANDLANMGLTIVSFTIRDIKDNHGYLDALGKPRTAEVKRTAIIAQAEADRDSAIKSAQANRDATIGQAQSNRDATIGQAEASRDSLVAQAEATRAGQVAQIAANTKIAEATRNNQVSVQEYQKDINQKKAEAELAYDLQRAKSSQAVKAEQVQIDIIEKQKQIELQQQEALRKERELEATVRKPADAARYNVEQYAAAERFKRETEAAGAASAIKATGVAEAEAAKAKGIAQADVIKAQGFAEADAMAKKAESFKQYNEAAVIQMMINILPDVAGKISEPLSKTDKITIISNGNGDNAGASKITADITTIMSQLPAVMESLTGVQLNRLIEQVPALKASMAKDEETKKK